MINPTPTSHEDFLSRRYPKGDIPVNFKIGHENEKMIQLNHIIMILEVAA